MVVSGGIRLNLGLGSYFWVMFFICSCLKGCFNLKIERGKVERWFVERDGSFGVTVVSEKESRGLKIFIKCREKYLDI